MDKVLVFDIETIPDIAGLRTIYHLPSEMPEERVYRFALRARRAEQQKDFFPIHLHQVVAISFLFRQEESALHIGTIGQPEDKEAVLIKKFFKKIDERSPVLVSWNGGGFDLPVLQHRGLIHGVVSPRYWSSEGEAKWNNYFSRYHTRHIDLMDILSRYQAQARTSLSDMAKLCGFPGKLNMDGGDVWQSYLTGDLQKIRDYCEIDVANTYLLFLRFQLFRGLLTQETYEDEIQLLRSWLQKQDSIHWQTFLKVWQSAKRSLPS